MLRQKLAIIRSRKIIRKLIGDRAGKSVLSQYLLLMMTIENIETGDIFEGVDLEYFVDDDTFIGEVFLDGDLIHQGFDVADEDQLKEDFRMQFFVSEEEDYNIFI
mgnify:FL=1